VLALSIGIVVLFVFLMLRKMLGRVRSDSKPGIKLAANKKKN
jgi:hypothetical protein